MPVAAVALAASSFAAGAAAFTAATTIGGMVAAGATMVGSALSIVGTVTGNAKLSKIGGVLALGGMAGTAMINSSANAAASTAGAAAGEAATETAAAAVEGGAALNEAAQLSDAAIEAGSKTASGMADAASTAAASGAPSAGMEAVSTVAADSPSSLLQSITGESTAAQPITNVSATNPYSTGSINVSDAGATQVGQAAEMTGLDPETVKLLRQQTIAQRGGEMGTSSSFLDRASQWVKNNKEMAKLGTDVAGGLIGNLVPSDEQKARTELAKQQAELLRRRTLWAQGRTA